MTTTSQRVVLHASDQPGDVNRAVAAGEVLAGKLPGVEIAVIVNGAALDGALKQADAVRALPRVKVYACALGMSRRNLVPADLQVGIGTVESAVLALAREQLDGAAYIRI